MDWKSPKVSDFGNQKMRAMLMKNTTIIPFEFSVIFARFRKWIREEFLSVSRCTVNYRRSMAVNTTVSTCVQCSMLTPISVVSCRSDGDFESDCLPCRNHSWLSDAVINLAFPFFNRSGQTRCNSNLRRSDSIFSRVPVLINTDRFEVACPRCSLTSLKKLPPVL